jgi:phage terminase large subunit-like protein
VDFAHKRAERLRDFVDLCHQVGFELQPFQVKIASALLGDEREKLITLPRKNGKSRLIGAFAAWHLLRTPEAQAIVVANSKEQAQIIDNYARAVAMHPSVETKFEPRFRELRGPDGSTLQVKSADARRALGLTPTLAVYDEYCAAKDSELYVALRSALLPGATMFTVTTAGWGLDTPLGRLRARALAQPDVRVKGCLTDARGPHLRMLEWMVPEAVPLDDFHRAKQANPLSLITTKWLREQHEALHEIDYQRFHLNRWVGRIGSWLPAGAWAACANGSTPIPDGSKVWIGVDIGGARADTAVVWIDEGMHVGCWIGSGDEAMMEAPAVLLEVAGKYRVQEVVFDPWRAQTLAQIAEAHRIRTTAFPQSDSRMIPASAALHEAIVKGQIHHPDDPKLNAHVAAAVARHGRRGWRIDQAERGTPVDGLVALVMAYEAASAPEPEPGRAYFI